MKINPVKAALGGGVVLALAGCAPEGPGQNAAELQALPASRACVSNLPPFGYWRYAAERFNQYYVPPNGTITVGDDGGWCQIQFQHFVGDAPARFPLAVKDPPAHGEAMAGSIGTSLRIAYRPTPGFVGQDAFTVHMIGPQPWDIPVHVTVVGRQQ